MNSTHPPRLGEDTTYLVLMTAPPSIWMAHFVASYATASVWCARLAAERGAPLGGVRIALAIYTAIALIGIIVAGWYAWHRHTHEDSPPPHRGDTAADRHRFLGYATLLLSGLSLVGTIFVGWAGLTFQTCR